MLRIITTNFIELLECRSTYDKTNNPLKPLQIYPTSLLNMQMNDQVHHKVIAS